MWIHLCTLMPLGLSLEEAEMQRTTKRPQMLGFKSSRRGAENIKKIREHELGRLEAMVGVPFTWDHGPHPHHNPLTSRFSSRDLDGNEIRPCFLYRTCLLFFLELFSLNSIFILFLLSMMGKHPIFL